MLSENFQWCLRRQLCSNFKESSPIEGDIGGLNRDLSEPTARRTKLGNISENIH